MRLLPGALAVLCLELINHAIAQRSTSTTDHSTHRTTSHESSTTSSSVSASGSISFSASLITLSSFSTPAFTGSHFSYATIEGQSTISSSTRHRNASASISGAAANSTGSHRTTKTNSLTELVGHTHTSTTNATGTTLSATPTNTVPCNGYPEFCNRKYSNITQVCAHNSAFAIKNNAGSNQELPVMTQLNDGVRMIQGETHYENNTIYNCHTTCNLLNAGPWETELATVAQWLDRNPYDVVTWLVVNSDFVTVEKYLPAIEASGIKRYLYEPQFIPQYRSQWPTLGEMILSNKRLVMFMDYNANQTAVPYILDEFTHMWETPFSPVDPAFPCTQQRPPHLNQTLARDELMYLANHNLNTAVDLTALLGGGSASGGADAILIPNTAAINNTNGLERHVKGQMGKMAAQCTEMWARPPNFLLVDYYNRGDPYEGSVFAVAAQANNVSYSRKRCCGTDGDPSAAAGLIRPMAALWAGVVGVVVAVGLGWAGL